MSWRERDRDWLCHGEGKIETGHVMEKGGSRDVRSGDTEGGKRGGRERFYFILFFGKRER